MPCHEPNTTREMGAVTREAASVAANTIADHFGINSDNAPAIGVEQTMMANNAQYERSAPVESMVQGKTKSCTMHVMASNCRIGNLWRNGRRQSNTIARTKEDLNPTMQTYTTAPAHASGWAIRFPTTLFPHRIRIRTRQWRCIPDRANIWAQPLPIAICRNENPCAPGFPSTKAFATVAAAPPKESRRCENMCIRRIRPIDRRCIKEEA